MNIRNRRQVNGVLLLDKPVGWTSNAALQAVKRLYQAAKAGHTGSLDPLASGLFQAMMQVSLCNDGPVTILLDSHKNF